MNDIMDEFRLTMDYAAKRASFVHMPNKIVVFKQLENNLYGMDPRDSACYISMKNYEVTNVQMLNKVEDNLMFISK